MLSTMFASMLMLIVLMLAFFPGPARSADFTSPPRRSDAPLTRHRGTVLVIRPADCRDASVVLARVSRHIRDAERSALYSPEAEDDYDDAIEAIIETRCAEGIRDLRAADRMLRDAPDTELIFSADTGGGR